MTTARSPRSRLKSYQQMRVSGATPEPGLLQQSRSAAEAGASQRHASTFVVQLHFARRRHFDFRLEVDGTLRSWAVPKGPSLDPAVKRLAVEVEDHPIEYGSFEGSIPEGHYGAGEVIIWDRGVWKPVGAAAETRAALKKGHLDFELSGERLRGAWSLIRTSMRGGKPQWLLIKQADAMARRNDVADDTALTDWQSIHDSMPAMTRAAIDVTKGPKSLHAAGRAAPFPRSIGLPLARSIDRAPAGDGWLHEIKFDGYRVLLFRNNRSIRIESRNGVDYTDKLPVVVKALARLKPSRFVLDGELVATDAEGRTSFGLLQQRLGDGGVVELMLFDAPYLGGRDLRDEPLIVRKRHLKSIPLPSAGPLRHVEYHVGDGAALFAASCPAGLEGLICKSADSPYRQGRTGDWLKLKCIDSAEFVVVGFTAGKGARAALGSLLLASPAPGTLAWRYVGRVGSGLNDAALARFGKALSATRTPVKLDMPPTREQLLGAKPVWLKPRWVVEVEFRGWTEDGKLRQAVFKTIRDDRSIDELTRENTAPKAISMIAARTGAPRHQRIASPAPPNDAPIHFSHPNRELFEKLRVTKLEIGEFYRAIAESILPELVNRPLSLLRCPQGVGADCFFQKHLTPGFGEAVREFRTGRRGEKLPFIEDIDGLLGLVQMNVIEFHPWGAQIQKVECPDRLVFDLDPAADVPWKCVIAAARELRERLAALKLESFVRTSGGKGLHVVMPLTGNDDWGSAKSFTQAMARTLTEESPDRYVDVATKARRKGRIFVDYLRNGRGATSVASYSLRARPGAPLAVPLSWNELGGVRSGGQFHFRNLRQRLARIDDPWRGIADVRQALPRLTSRN